MSGNINTTFALYDFYQRQLEENNNESVVATTALARLPTNIQYNVHDVAHLLKKLLYGLPGGLLGKPAVFQALYNVHTFVYPDPSLGDEMSLKVKPRMIALALSSINLHFRIALICAVFGLLRTINLASEQETLSKVKDPHETYIQMRDDSLGTVFAPLLLGDKSQHILVDDNEDRGGLLVLPTADQNGHSTNSRKDRPDLHEAKKEAERMRRAAMVAQMLIDNWEDIAYQMKRINTLGITAQAYDIPVSQPQNTLQRAGTFRYRGKGQPQLGPLKTEYVPIADKFATVRSTRLEEPLYSHSQPQSRQTSRGSDHSRNWSGQYDSIRSQPQTGDLLRFDSQKSNRKALDQDLFKPPLNLADTLGMSPIAESVATRSISTPVTKEPASTPNWRAFSDPPTRLASPFRLEATSSPNWRNFGDSGQFGLESSPNWRNPQTPTQTGSQASPNWRNIRTPSQLASESSPNWRDVRTPDRSGPETSPNWQQFATPSEGGLHGSPNWRQLATPSEPEPHATPNWLALAPPSEVDLLVTPNWLSLAPPSELDLLATPNWRLLATDDESYRPDTPVKKFRIPYAETETEPEPELEADKVSLSSSRAGSAHSSGTSSGARTPPQEVTPQIARRITTQFNTASISSFADVIMGDSLALSAPPELDTPEADKRKPSIYGRRAISPEPELTLRKDSRGTFGDSEQVDEYLDEYRPTTPKPLNFRKKQSSFSIYEDHPDKTPKGQRPTLPVNSPVLSLRKPNSQVDIKISPNGKKASPSRPLPESPAHSQSAPFHTATSNRRARASTVNDAEASRLPKELGSPSSPEKKSRGGGNTALYAEIQRLQRLVDLKTEEANSTRKELELAQRMANAGTLSQILRETQEELKVWKNRAEWAEKQLKQKNTSRDSEIKRSVVHGHATRYSVS